MLCSVVRRCLPSITWIVLLLAFFSLSSNAATPIQDWSYKLPTSTFSSPTITSDGSIIIGCGGSSDALGSLLSIGPQGKLNWMLSTGDIAASPSLGNDDTIYVGSTQGIFFSISPQGTTNWFLPTTNITQGATNGLLHSSAAIGTDGIIYFTSLGGRIIRRHP